MSKGYQVYMDSKNAKHILKRFFGLAVLIAFQGQAFSATLWKLVLKCRPVLLSLYFSFALFLFTAWSFSTKNWIHLYFPCCFAKMLPSEILSTYFYHSSTIH